MNEKNNIGIDNNDLPAMGTVTNNNVNINNTTNKFNLPPISSFTNFDNNHVNNNVNDTNVSVFDLMNEFDDINKPINDKVNDQEVSNAEPLMNNGLGVFSSIPNSNVGSVNEVTNNIRKLKADNTPLTFNTANEQVQPQAVNMHQTVESESTPLTFNTENEQVQPQATNMHQTIESESTPLTFNTVNEQVQPQAINMHQTVESELSPLMFNTVSKSTNTQVGNIQEISSSNVSSAETNTIVESSINNNISLDENQINSIAASVFSDANINNQSTTNETVEVLKNTIENEKQEKSKKERNPKKNRKILLLIILLVSFAIIIGSLILCYFMFLKKDKLICEYQDYSSEDFLFSEVVTINFKGRQMSDAKFVETLTFTESGLLKKDVYQADLQNQFEGMGFNVTYIDTDDEIQVTMDFTKENLENWTGTEIKSATKQNLLREMKNSGYTCK